MAARQALARSICEIGRRLYARELVAGTEGNISVRLTPQQVLCTPTFVCKGFMKPGDLCVVDLHGRQISGRRKRTSEILLHVELYRACPEIHAVVHCHPPVATAWSVTRRALPGGVHPESDLLLGDVPIVPYETPGTAAFAELIRPHASPIGVAILKNHGAVAWAESLERAWAWTEILEGYCRVLTLAERIGEVDPLPEAKRDELRRGRKQLLGD